jgi:phage tail tape-measure protein
MSKGRKTAMKSSALAGLKMVGGAAAGAAAGSLAGPVGAAVGAVVGGIAGARANQIVGSKPMKQVASTIKKRASRLTGKSNAKKSPTARGHRKTATQRPARKDAK